MCILYSTLARIFRVVQYLHKRVDEEDTRLISHQIVSHNTEDPVFYAMQ